MSVASQLRPEAPITARYEALFRVSQAISAHRDPKELFGVLAGELRRVVRSDYVCVVLYDEMTNKMCWHVLDVLNQPGVVRPCDFEDEETLAWWVHRHQEPLVISSVNEESRFPRMMDLLREQGIRSTCTLPLTTAHRRLGSLGVGCKDCGAYSEEEVRFLSLVADQVAMAIDDALNFEASERAHRDLQREKDRLRLLLDLNNTVVSNLELRDLLRSISASLRSVMQCDGVGVLLPDSESNQLRLYALDFPESKGIIQEEIGEPVEEDSAPARVFRTGEPLTLRSRELAQVDRLAAAEGIESLCLLPLLSRNRVLGVLGLGRLQ